MRGFWLTIVGILMAGFSRPAPRALEDVPWNGGKARGPIEISSPQVGVLNGDKEGPFPVDVLVRFRQDCEDLRLRVRGLDGVEVLDAGGLSLPTCPVDENLSHRVQVRIPPGSEGQIAVDVVYRNGGRNFAETRSLILVDPKERTEQILKQQRVEVQGDERLQILPAISHDGGANGTSPDGGDGR